MKETTREVVKPAVVIAAALLILGFEGMKPQSALLITVAHLTWMLLSGTLVMRAAAWRPTGSWVDRGLLLYIFGWAALPLYIALTFVLKNHGISVILTLTFIGLYIWWKKTDRREEISIEIPWAVYLLALAFLAVSVAVPFSSFNEENITRELFADGVQRFGSAYAVAESIPPLNPFFAGAPLQYYWFSLYPFAVEYRYLPASLFDIWKCNLSWLAFAFVPFVWFFCHRSLKSLRGANWAVALAFLFPSYEIFGRLFELPATGWEQSAMAGWFSSLLARDPDMIAGIVTAYSDQLLMEDFLYLPQNAVALVFVLLGLLFLQQNRTWWGLLTFSTLAGINTFFVLPIFPAFFLWEYFRSGRRRAFAHSCLLAVYTGGWLALCNIIDSAWTIPLALTALLTTGALRIYDVPASAALSSPDELGRLRLWSCLFLILIILMILWRPLWNLPVLLANYGPSAVLAGIFLFIVVRWNPDLNLASDWGAFLFLLMACAAYLSWSLVLLLPHMDIFPLWLVKPFHILGLQVNPFNFYHKAGKLMRLSWAIWAGLGLAGLAATRIWRRPWLRMLLWAALVPAALTSLIRPLTYLSDGPHRDTPAAGYLESRGVSLETRVLLEDFRSSRLPQLVPVSVYYYAHWSGGHSGLTHSTGNWADQYLPGSHRPRTRVRERVNLHFFSNRATKPYRRRILEENHIDYILTSRPYDFAPFADSVLTEPSCFLYQIRKPN